MAKKEEGLNVNMTAVAKSAKSGARAAALRSAVRLATYPLDTMKTREQVGISSSSSLELKSPYAGAWIAVLGQLPAGALLVGSFDALRALGVDRATASFLAALPALLVKIPIESLKQKKQAQGFESQVNSNSSQTLAIIYQGGVAQALREVGFNSAQLVIFASTSGTPALRGAFAAALAALLTHPFDVVKTTAMTSTSMEPVNDFALATKILRTQGPIAFSRGLGPKVLHTAIGGAAFFAYL